MAQGLWKSGIHESDAVFYLTFSRTLSDCPYIIACGLYHVIRYLQEFHYSQGTVGYLDEMVDSQGEPYFDKEFLRYLDNLRHTCSVDAVPEGTLVFPGEPVIKISGPLLQCQMLKFQVTSYINFASLVATQSSLICRAAEDDEVIGIAHPTRVPQAAAFAGRATYIGGMSTTSNVLASKLFGVPALGTATYDWMMAFPSEQEAMLKACQNVPGLFDLVVDTFDAEQGIAHAIEVSHKEDIPLNAIRLRSDKVILQKSAPRVREVLDKEGFKETKIVAVGEFDEESIRMLKAEGLPIDAWVIRSHLIDYGDISSLEPSFNFAALKDGQRWRYKLRKTSSYTEGTLPGSLQVRRYFDKHGVMTSDVIFNTLAHELEEDNQFYADLLVPIFNEGDYVYESPSIHNIREDVINNINNFLSRDFNLSLVYVDNALKELRDNVLSELYQEE